MDTSTDRQKLTTFTDELLSDDLILVECDVAELNLLCAEGLPGAEALDIDRLLDRLDEMAADVERIIFLQEN